MPCSPQPCSGANSYVGPNFCEPSQYWTGNAYQHYANMGWVGFAKLLFPRGISWGGTSLFAANVPTMLRVTGGDLKLSQEINAAEVIDGRIDRTAYWLGPKIVEGTLNFPLMADNGVGGACVDGALGLTEAAKLLNAVWQWGVSRDSFGRLCFWDTDMIMRLANHAAFRYKGCLINELSLKVAQGDMVTMDIGVMARSRQAYDGTDVCPFTDASSSIDSDVTIADYLSPARVLTWNDFTVNGVQFVGSSCDTQSNLFYSNQIREFNLTINNNADRFFTLNGTLYPVDINVAKREITGSLTLLGYNKNLRVRAETNQDRFTSKDEIRLAAYVGEDMGTSDTGEARDWISGDYTTIGSSITTTDGLKTPLWARKIKGVMFQIEEVSLTNEVLETTVNYLAFGVDDLNNGDTTNYESIQPPTACGFPIWQ